MTRGLLHAPFAPLKIKLFSALSPERRTRPMHAYRTHTCGALRASDAGSPVRLSGWIHRKRDHGGLMFIDLRDNYGLTQLVLSPETPGLCGRRAAARRKRGPHRRRGGGARRPRRLTRTCPPARSRCGCARSRFCPKPPNCRCRCSARPDYPEELRLKYRYLDLRRDSLHRNILLAVVGDRLDPAADDREPGSPSFRPRSLTASSPEGARDYLVPSRLYPGQFYALPQAPQMFKQLLMVSGFRPLFPDRALLPRRGR